jgi:HTH-type transcriptional regulator, sugar sensing transcriptional regulator
MVVNTALGRLTSLGISEYEAKAYIALLRENPVTAYEAAKNSGVPTAKIYGVLAKLLEKGMVLELKEGEKKLYAPLEAEEYIRGYRQRMDGTLDELERDLNSLGPGNEISYIWNITGYGAFVDRAEMMLRKAEEMILLSAWHEELAPLLQVLRERTDAGVRCATVYFGTPETEVPGQLFPHPIADTLYQEKGGRGFAAVIDGTASIMGTIKEDSTVEGAWSGNQGFVTLAEDYIKHDIYIMKIVRRFDTELIDRFGPGYRRLRDIFSDTEEKEEEKDGGNLHRRRVVRAK